MQTKFGGYIGITLLVCLSVHPSICLFTFLVRATPLKQLKGFWCNFLRSLGMICRCAWRNVISLMTHKVDNPNSGLTCWYLVSATPLKQLKGFWRFFLWRLGIMCRCTWRNIITVGGLQREIINIKKKKFYRKIWYDM